MSYSVAVRTLCEFTAKRGDLDMRFTPSPTALEGMEGHAYTRAKRPAGYQSEISLSGSYGAIQVRGRADGYDPVLNRLEEIKTYRGDLRSMPEQHRFLHWAQAKIYGHLLCEKLNLEQLDVCLVYFDIVSRKETLICEHHTAQALRQFFESQCEQFAQWAEQEVDHRRARDQTLEALQFPHSTFRPGQRTLAVSVYKAVSQSRCLLAQATTGIGKTLGVLFPALKACPRQDLDKVFFLTAKTSGRNLALESLRTLKKDTKDRFPRVLELTAKEKTCEHPNRECHAESCPLARGFYDRLPAARSAAVALGTLDKATLRHVALEHDVCPYWLGQDLARWCDIIVGDYNYYFDVSGVLHSLTQLNQWRSAILVDEAHNLLDRAQAMYSAALDPHTLIAALEVAPPAIRTALERLAQIWDEIPPTQSTTYRAYPEIPKRLYTALLHASAALTEYPNTADGALPEALQALQFALSHFLRLADSFGTHSLFDVTLSAPEAEPQGPPHHAHVRHRVHRPQRGNLDMFASPHEDADATLCIRNTIPAPFLAPRFAAAQAVVLFSATLSPWNFYRDTLGLPADTAWTDVGSPFDSSQLDVNLVTHISTRYRQRTHSLSPIAKLMAQAYRERPGNYLSFFSSYEYLRQVMDEFRAQYPDIPVWSQERAMDEAARDLFLSRFTPDGRGIGFAVLGGAFAEGIDLPGQRLIGAFISGLGLPQTNPVNEERRRCIEATFGPEYGYNYVYLYPALRRVVQAAGRVIRTTEDRGVLYLIDDRYRRKDVIALLPPWWDLKDASLLTSA
jgi:DNA excision repair protein ERCC-2